MHPLAVYWDSSQLWGLLLCQSLQALHLPYTLLTAQDIAQGRLLDKPHLLIVPGGPAKLKFQALGLAGQEAIRSYIRNGGNYLGFCGGAGLALQASHSLQLCPWSRATIDNRLEHFISGHVPVNLLPKFENQLQDCISPQEMQLPIFWPGRFAPQVNSEVQVLATYHLPHPQQKASWQDLWMADVPLTALNPQILVDWQTQYGVNLLPSWLHAQPCIITGQYGQGQYILSYSHLETPDSPLANLLFIEFLNTLAKTNILTKANTLAQTKLLPQVIPTWNPEPQNLRWSHPVLLQARQVIQELIQLGLTHSLLCQRTPWLLGWRQGMPGPGLNTLYLTIMTLLSQNPTSAAQAYLQQNTQQLLKNLPLFRAGAERLILGLRLSQTLAEAVPKAILDQERLFLFGSAMRSGGLYLQIYEVLEKVLEENLKKSES